MSYEEWRAFIANECPNIEPSVLAAAIADAERRIYVELSELR